MKFLLALCVCAAVAAAQSPSFAIGFPVAALSNSLAAENAAVVDDVNALPIPGTCCYDDVGADAVHLDFQGNAIVTTSTTAGLACTSSSFESVIVGLTASLTVESTDYRLCLHDDPFGNGCSTLYSCSGDGDLTFSIDATVGLAIGVDAGTGGINITQTSVDLTLGLPSSTMCSHISDSVVSELPTFEADFEGLVGPYLSTAIADVISLVPQSDPIFNDTTWNWVMLPGTSTTDDGIELVGTGSVVYEGNTAPFQPRTTLPDLSSLMTASDTSSVLVVADSILSNGAWVYYQTNPQFIFSDSVLGQNISFTANLTSSPMVYFNDNSDNETFIVVEGGAKGTLGDDVFVATFVLEAPGTATIANNTFLLQLEAKTTTTNITLVSGNVSALLLTVLQDAVGLVVIPEVNTFLAENAIAIPVLADVSFEDPTLSFGDGYAYGSVVLDIVPNYTPFPWAPIACPTSIDGGHEDSCI